MNTKTVCKTKKLNDYRGFTLIELMVVIAMTTVLMAVAIPSVRALVENIGVNRAAQELISEIYLARIQAIRTGRTSTVTFNVPAPNQCTIDWNDGRQRAERSIWDPSAAASASCPFLPAARPHRSTASSSRAGALPRKRPYRVGETSI